MENIILEKQYNKSNRNKRYCIISNDSNFILLSLIIDETNILFLAGGNLNNNNHYINYK